MGYGNRESNLVRQAQLVQASIAANVLTNFIIEDDIDGNRIPARIKITDILVRPSVSTIRELQLFGKETRLDTGLDGHSLIYQDTWAVGTTASAAQTAATTDRSYYDRDASDQREGTIWGTLKIKAGESASAFVVDIFFTE